MFVTQKQFNTLIKCVNEKSVISSQIAVILDDRLTAQRNALQKLEERILKLEESTKRKEKLIYDLKIQVNKLQELVLNQYGENND